MNFETIDVADPSTIRNTFVVVMDDVATTGSTITACVERLWNVGVSGVGGIVLGKTIQDYGYDPSYYSGGSSDDLDDEIPF